MKCCSVVGSIGSLNEMLLCYMSVGSLTEVLLCCRECWISYRGYVGSLPEVLFCFREC